MADAAQSVRDRPYGRTLGDSGGDRNPSICKKKRARSPRNVKRTGVVCSMLAALCLPPGSDAFAEKGWEVLVTGRQPVRPGVNLERP